MKVKKNRVMSMICILSLAMAVNVSAAPKTEMERYERDGMMYIEKTYTIGAEEDISDVADGSFDLNGYSYHQIDMKSESVVETEEKTVEELKKASVSSQGMAQIIEKIGEIIEYADEDGFLSFVFGSKFAAHFADAAVEFFLTDQNAGNVFHHIDVSLLY